MRHLYPPIWLTPLLLLTACTRPTFQDLSPDSANGISQAEPSTAGLTVNLGGNSSHLYAVSLNAGVWRNDGQNGTWKQLLNSPRRAYSIAVDPENINHVVVGERDDLRLPSYSRTSGVWESFNAGDDWQYILDPTTLGCATQAISSLVFTSTRALIAGTTCGVARREYQAHNFTIVFAQGSAVTALVSSPDRVWARTVDQVMFADPYGNGWSQVSVPAQFTSDPQPYSMAASGSFAYLGCCSVKNAGSPCAADNVILIFNSLSTTWYLQPRLTATDAVPATGCSGLGLGGSLFLRSFFTAPQNPKSMVLFDSSSEEIYRANPSVVDGTAQSWIRVLGATCGGCTNQDLVHPDLWDFLYNLSDEWASNDGGVYQYHPNIAQPWRMLNAGLHTHHVHTLTVMSGSSIAYPTSDNEAWYSSSITSPSSWHHTNDLGDVNWSDGDFSNTQHALVVRQGDCAALVSPGSGQSQNLALSYDLVTNSPEGFKIIQTIATESGTYTGGLDAVMLVRLPLHYQGGTCEGPNGTTAVPGKLGNASLANQPYLIRNRTFDSTPDINLSQGSGWTLETAVPPGTTRFWVAGGHSAPVYYAYAVESDGGHLFKQTSQNVWQELNVQGTTTGATPYPNSQMVDSVYKGPVFVNPYNPSKLYVLTASGIQVSEDSGGHFTTDSALTTLVTGNSGYPLTPGFAGDSSDNVRKTNRFNLNPLGALTSMAFRRDQPSVAVAASPYTGIFCKCGGTGWTDLNSFFPNPIAPISSVAIDPVSVYFATEGRGIGRLIGYQNAGLYLWLESWERKVRR